MPIYLKSQLYQTSVDALVEQLNMSMDPDPTIGDINGNTGTCP